MSPLIAIAAFVCNVALAQSSTQPSIQYAQDPAPADVTESAQPQSGVRAGFWWADYDRDGLDDAFVVGADGTARLLRNIGDGSFADVTLLSGLDGLGAANFAAWNDYDRDGAPDVFVGTQSGPGHLMRNAGDGTFQDVTQFVGLTHSGRHIAAQWFDYDLDGLNDLSVRTDAGEHLYHALLNGHFEAVDLGSVKPLLIIDSSADIVEINAAVETDDSTPVALDKPASRKPSNRPPSGLNSVPVRPTRLRTAPPLPLPGSYLISACPPKIADASGGGCLSASSVATLGMLYPLSIDLNVNGAGNVGIGTVTPAAKLDVVGTARMSDTLTLNPVGDQALNVSTGSIYKSGFLFAHTKGGFGNTAIGQQALSSVTSGAGNTASGYLALGSNTSGSSNTAGGYRALFGNTSGTRNTASGYGALGGNTTGTSNSAAGFRALGSNTTGNYNSALGASALVSNTTGANNTASGHLALGSNTTGYSNSGVGARALTSNTTGHDNTASGYLALSSNTIGRENTAMGARALVSNTAGIRNTANGFSALTSNTAGAQNTASGYSSLTSNTTGSYNTASGARALASNTAGSYNTASGTSALAANTNGRYNTASGAGALGSNTSGERNTANGNRALVHNTTGGENTASGHLSLYFNTTGIRNTASGIAALGNNTSGNENTAIGYGSLNSNTIGSRNIAVGRISGSNLTTGSYNIAIGSPGVAGDAARIRIGTPGTQTKAFIAGIRGVTTINANAIPVLVDSAGQLGTVSSSRRFKKDIVDMGAATKNLLKLRPVRFRYKQEQTMPDGSEVPMEYGLIAEEVAEIFPDLVVYGDDGKPFTVKYHILSSMLLNEMEKQAIEMEKEKLVHVRDLEDLRRGLAEQQSELTRLHGLEARLAALEARTAAATPSAGAPVGIR